MELDAATSELPSCFWKQWRLQLWKEYSTRTNRIKDKHSWGCSIYKMNPFSPIPEKLQILSSWPQTSRLGTSSLLTPSRPSFLVTLGKHAFCVPQPPRKPHGSQIIQSYGAIFFQWSPQNFTGKHRGPPEAQYHRLRVVSEYHGPLRYVTIKVTKECSGSGRMKAGCKWK